MRTRWTISVDVVRGVEAGRATAPDGGHRSWVDRWTPLFEAGCAADSGQCLWIGGAGTRNFRSRVGVGQ